LNGVTSFVMGDRFATSNGTLTISNNSSRVILQKNSAAVVRQNVVDLGCGSGLVRTGEGLAVHVGSVEVKPQIASSNYTVSSLRDKQLVAVTAEVGQVSVSSAGHTVFLNAGETAKFTSGCDIPGFTPAAAANAAAVTTGMSLGAKAAVASSLAETATAPLFSMGKNASPHK
jgi:hypothetical protein